MPDKKNRSSARLLWIASVALATTLLLLGIFAPNASPSVTQVSASHPFSIEYTITPQGSGAGVDNPIHYALEFVAVGNWKLTVIDGGELTGYYQEARPQFGEIAGYPSWSEPQVLAAPGSKDANSVPASFFVPRALPGSIAELTSASATDPEVTSLARDLARDPARLVKFTVGDESTVYDLDLGIPLLVRYGSDPGGEAVYRVTKILSSGK